MRYRRAYQAGASYFFTVVTRNRRPLLARPNNIDHLREAFRNVKQQHPFTLDAIVILPDHLHSLWTLPTDDADFSRRWRLIKTHFVKHSGERDAFQPRFWEHMIRDERDFEQHLTYIHYNPVRHGLVQRVVDWPHSSFHRFLRDGVYEANWGTVEPLLDSAVGNE